MAMVAHSKPEVESCRVGIKLLMWVVQLVQKHILCLSAVCIMG
jgi:hypothetical protein